MPLLKKGVVLGSDATGDCYRVISGRVGAGGFGEVYRGQLLDERRDPVLDVAVKVLTDARSWHGEAYFGTLLAGQDRVVHLLDAFQIASGSGAARIVRYGGIWQSARPMTRTTIAMPSSTSTLLNWVRGDLNFTLSAYAQEFC